MRWDMLLVTAAVAALVLGGAPADAQKGDKIMIGQQWNGLYPVNKLDLLPKDQQKAHSGFIDDARTFEAVWKAFKPDDKVPEVKFGESLVVFSRNLQYLNSNTIASVLNKEGTIEVLAIETRTAKPIQDKLYFSLAVIPRQGVKKFQDGKTVIDVPAGK